MKQSIILIISSLYLLSCSSSQNYVREKGRIMLTADSAKWYLTFPENDFWLEKKITQKDDSSGYFLFSSSSIGITVSVFIEPSGSCFDSRCCRDRAWIKQMAFLYDATDIKLSSIGEAWTYEYLLPNQFNHKNINAHLYKDGFWLDIHISKVNYTKTDDELFTDFLESISFYPKNRNLQ